MKRQSIGRDRDQAAAGPHQIAQEGVNGGGSGVRDGGAPFASAPNSAPDSGLGGFGLPALIGSLGVMTALGAALGGSGASRTENRRRPAPAMAQVDDD